MKKGILKSLFYFAAYFIFISQSFAAAAELQGHLPLNQQILNSVENPLGLTMKLDYGNFPLKNALFKTDYPYDDAYMVKVAPQGKKLEYSSYLGGSKYDRGYDVAVSPDGTAYYFGYTSSPDFPRVSSLQQLNLGKKV